MLVQKKSSLRQIALSFIAMATLGVAIYIFMGGTKKAEEDSFLFGNEDVTSDSTTFINLNTSIFSDKQVTGLRDRTTEPYTNQYSGVSYNKDTIVPPEGMSVYDPKVGKKLIIYWDKVDSGSTVRIYRSEIQDKIGEVLVDKLSDENNYQDTNLKNGAYYYYTVRTVNSEGKESSNTKQVVGIPTDSFAPQNPTGIAIRDLLTGDKIEISWINPSDLDFDHIRIYRSQKEGELGTTILDKKTEETKFIDDTVQTGITYYYTITAIDQSGNESEKTLLPSDRNSSPFEPLF